MFKGAVIKGFKFGMLLQFAIGPVCIFVFQTASTRGLLSAEFGVLGVALMDGLFISAAVLGIASIIEKNNVKTALKIFGASVLLIFGISTILNQFNINFLPGLSLQSNGSNSFIKAVILTASSPLTILFWAGVFSAKISSEGMEKKDMYYFGMGALLSTVFFLTLISIVGTVIKGFITMEIIKTLNLLVGVLLLYFGFRMLIKKV
ncbi:MAG: LysE family transporter [Solirubrobacterales bacterium]